MALITEWARRINDLAKEDMLIGPLIVCQNLSGSLLQVQSQPIAGVMRFLARTAKPGSTLPYLLTRMAAQLIYARYKVMHVPSGSGISYITAYGQNQVPLSRHDLFYTYQGLSRGGQYVITVRMPLLDPILPAGNDLPSGVTLEQFQQNWAGYVAATKLKLDAQRDMDFTPDLVLMSNLVNCIGYHP